MNVIDWLWSIGFYTSVIFALVGAFGLIKPMRRVHRGRRLHAAVMLLIGLAAAYAITRTMPRTQAGDRRSVIDEFVPAVKARAERTS